jgi:hypothetical protein
VVLSVSRAQVEPQISIALILCELAEQYRRNTYYLFKIPTSWLRRRSFCHVLYSSLYLTVKDSVQYEYLPHMLFTQYTGTRQELRCFTETRRVFSSMVFPKSILNQLPPIPVGSLTTRHHEYSPMTKLRPGTYNQLRDPTFSDWHDARPRP